MLCLNAFLISSLYSTLEILIEGVFDVVSEPLVDNTNKQVLDGKDAGVDDCICIGDNVLNEIDKIAKKITTQCRDNDGGVGNVEERVVVAYTSAKVVYPLYDISLDYGNLNVKKKRYVTTEVLTNFFGNVGDDNQDDEEKI